MSIDKMILQIDNECSYPEALAIIAALKTGQAMRDSKSMFDLHEAEKAWDAATKEEV